MMILLEDFAVSIIISLTSLIQIAGWGLFLLYRMRRVGRLEKRWLFLIGITGFLTYYILERNLYKWLFGIGW